MVLPPEKAECGHPIAYGYWQRGNRHCERCKREEAEREAACWRLNYEAEKLKADTAEEILRTVRSEAAAEWMKRFRSE